MQLRANLKQMRLDWVSSTERSPANGQRSGSHPSRTAFRILLASSKTGPSMRGKHMRAHSND